ncbi:MAG: phosphatase PAP2 family protein [Clostridium argentinense]|uniref:Phosphatase PAP2 family protein n=1 Tax=Clostridium faecium TaxID=2762223 RepID=A0ABR8YN97_9CLOT|nr:MULTISPECIES: phosphatase PAP2 family protein [Clostridium]MBD8045666.1 phosphatase PAP2 family protein [Clostridium faecium]MBS5824819.1 phosphatase PAP2 family protein [Clostridium argentinense]MDU1350878.1 phosphatase PAP2 family protein [Clostridium argentinense]
MLKYIHTVDKTLIDFIHHNLRNPLFDKLMPLITHLGDGGAIWIIISIILLFNKDYSHIGFLCLISLLLSTVLTEGIIKNIVERVRPIIRYPISDPLINIPKSFSFPSGHTSSSFAVATILFILLPQYKIIPIVLALLIGFSRIYLYVHYPSDVFAGILVGILSAFIVILGYNVIKKHKL